MKFSVALLVVFIIVSVFTRCVSNPQPEAPKSDSVAANIRMYTHTWDEIINHRRLELFNDSNFTRNMIMHANPDIVGIDSARAYYADVFGQGNKLVKHWNFSGRHTGLFFGMAATGKKVSIDGVRLVRMEGGRIAEERDFFDNLDLMT